MWFAVISSLICIALATILFTPPLRRVSFYRALSFYFLFKGAWSILTFIVGSFWKLNDLFLIIDYIGGIILLTYVFISIYIFYKKNK